MSFRIDGLDELQSALQQLQNRVQELAGTHEVPLSDLLSREFLQGHTSFSSFDELLKAGGFHADTTEEFEAIPETELDAHVARCSAFSTWHEMLEEAAAEYFQRRFSG